MKNVTIQLNPEAYLAHKVLLIIPAVNEGEKIKRVVSKIPKDRVTEILVVDDGSDDGACDRLGEAGASVLRHDRRQGIGVAIRNGLKYGLENGYEIVCLMAGNDKDEPQELGRLLDPILRGEADFVQGSRYIDGGVYGKMPKHRFMFTKLYSALLSLLTGARVTDATNGFRAYRTNILRDDRIRLDQEWLRDNLEYYLLVKVLKLKYRYTEVPATKLYPKGARYGQYTKIKPFSGWVVRLLPLLFLTFRIKD